MWTLVFYFWVDEMISKEHRIELSRLFEQHILTKYGMSHSQGHLVVVLEDIGILSLKEINCKMIQMDVESLVFLIDMSKQIFFLITQKVKNKLVWVCTTR